MKVLWHTHMLIIQLELQQGSNGLLQRLIPFAPEIAAEIGGTIETANVSENGQVVPTLEALGTAEMVRTVYYHLATITSIYRFLRKCSRSSQLEATTLRDQGPSLLPQHWKRTTHRSHQPLHWTVQLLLRSTCA